MKDYRYDARFTACDNCGTWVLTDSLVHYSSHRTHEGWYCQHCWDRRYL